MFNLLSMNLQLSNIEDHYMEIQQQSNVHGEFLLQVSYKGG